jgi:hypothetical protein
MNLKKLLAIVLVLAMVMSFMPTMAFADDDVIVEEEYVEEPVADAVDEADEVVDEDVADEPSDVYDEPEEEQLEGWAWGDPVTVYFYTDSPYGSSVYSAQATAATTEQYYYVADEYLTAAEKAVQAAKPTKKLDGWLDANNQPIQIDKDHPFKVTAGYVDILGKWGADLIPVTYAFAAGTPAAVQSAVQLPTQNPEYVAYGSSPVSVIETTVEGYNFVGYYVGLTKYTSLSAITITADTTVELKWEPKSATQATVTFNYNGAAASSIVGPIKSGTVDVVEFTVEKGTTIPASKYNAAPNNEDSHLLFDKWVPGGSYTLDGTVSGDETFTASWKAEAFEVTFTVDGKVDTAHTQNVNYGKTAQTYTPTPASGTHQHETFSGWSLTEGGAVVVLANYPITQKTNFYAVWVGDPQTVHFNLNGGTGTSADQFRIRK